MKKDETKEHQILLYYKYINIEDPEALKVSQRELCEKLGLLGRIIVSHEGINGTVEGTFSNTDEYVSEMMKDDRFADIVFKKSFGDGDSFPRLSVKNRGEIVSLKLGNEDINPNELTGNRLTADELREWYKEDKDFVMVDMRNDYEYSVGRFDKSIHPNLRNFRDLSTMSDELEKYKDKTVVTYCTGGVRCEKASGLLIKKGFKDVYQLHDGMVTYMEKYPAENFKGSLFVFDKRQTMYFEDEDKHVVIGVCGHCKKSAERMRNCADTKCNKKYIGCKDCVESDRSRECPACEEKKMKVSI